MKKIAKYNDSWMYILLLSTTIMLVNSLADFKFLVKGVELNFSIFLLPSIYAITNCITKKYGFKKGLQGIIISAIALVLFILLMHFSIGKELLFFNALSLILAYLVSQIVNIMIYKFLLDNTTSPYILLLLNAIFSIVVYNIIFTLTDLNSVIKDNFWTSYFIVLVVEGLISLPLTLIDKKIPLGKGKED